MESGCDAGPRQHPLRRLQNFLFSGQATSSKWNSGIRSAVHVFQCPAPSWRRQSRARTCAPPSLFVAHLDLDLAATDTGWCFELTVSLGDGAVGSMTSKKAVLRHA